MTDQTDLEPSIDVEAPGSLPDAIPGVDPDGEAGVDAEAVTEAPEVSEASSDSSSVSSSVPDSVEDERLALIRGGSVSPGDKFKAVAAILEDLLA